MKSSFTLSIIKQENNAKNFQTVKNPENTAPIFTQASNKENYPSVSNLNNNNHRLQKIYNPYYPVPKREAKTRSNSLLGLSKVE